MSDDERLKAAQEWMEKHLADIGPSGNNTIACKDCGVRFHHTAEQCKEIQRVKKEHSCSTGSKI